MKNIFKYVFMMAWLIIFTIVFAGIWLDTPELWFINLPEPAWNFLADVTGSHCCESVADLEAGVGIGFGFILASIILVSFLYIRKRMNKKNE